MLGAPVDSIAALIEGNVFISLPSIEYCFTAREFFAPVRSWAHFGQPDFRPVLFPTDVCQ